MTKIFLFPSPHGSQEEDYIFDEDMQGKKEILNPNSQNTNSAFQNRVFMVSAHLLKHTPIFFERF